MVRMKNVFILLLALMFFLNSPAYPKSRKIGYLPSDTTMDSVSKDYTNPDAPNKDDPGYDRDFRGLHQIDPGSCDYDFKGIASCRKCAKWRKDCPDCCLTDSFAAIKCTAGESADYACTEPPFQVDECSKIECDDLNEEERCELAEPVCSGSTVSENSYRLYGKGCPKKDSGDLAPNGSCTLLSGSGLYRKWKCSSGNLQPKSGGCIPDPDSVLSKPDASVYYVVIKAEPSCKPHCSTTACTSDCSSASAGCQVLSACTPSCEPSCDTDCISSCYSNCSTPESCKEFATCTPHSCIASSCWPGCSKEESCPSTGGKCSSWCTKSSCKPPGCSSSCTPEAEFYIYTLSQEVKDYITNCNDYADDYEECEDRITCCQENVCSSNKEPGFEANCTKGNKTKGSKCEDRAGCIGIGFCDETITDGQCIANVRLAAECLLEKERDSDTSNDLSQEISSDVRYAFTARNSESLTIEWQVVLDSLESKDIEEMEGISFYTLVKVEEVGAGAGVKPAHVSVLTIRDMENAFSIYGLTHVSKNELTPGKKYSAKIYYFFPKTMECNYNISTSEYEVKMVGEHEVKVKQLYLYIVRVKE